ncbi:MAG: hypothetical protein DRO23_09665 [Thermoprotei archaeon]|nr:MAG: hypothetical protein DRO23_09665 [Thermoprotei archaeon]
MELVLNLLIEDHEKFKKILNEIMEHVKDFNKEPKTPKEKFNIIKNIVFSLHKFTILAHTFENHVELRELTLSSIIIESNLEKQSSELQKCQKDITVLLKSIRETLSSFVNRETDSISETALITFRKFFEVRNVFNEFMRCEKKVLEEIKAKY